MGAVQSWCGAHPIPRRLDLVAKMFETEESTFSVSDIPHRTLYQTDETLIVDEKVSGSGTFGIVSRSVEKSAISVGSCRTVAVKRSAKEKEHHSLQNERSILATIDHPYIVKLFALVPTTPGPVWQLMEDCAGGELFSLLAVEGPLPDATAASYFRQIMLAVNHLHSVMKIIHRDIKPENVVLTNGNRQVKLCDFGTAVKLSSGRGSKATGRIGSLSYAAPEVYQTSQADFASDMWSAGVLLYVMCCAASPFRSSEDKDPEKEAVERVKRGEVNKKREKWKQLSSGPKKLILSLLRLDPSCRLRAIDVLCDPWLNEGRSNSRRLVENESAVDALRRFAEIQDDEVLRAWRALGSQLSDWDEGRTTFEWLDSDLDGIVGFNDLAITHFPVNGFRTCFTYSEVVAALLMALPPQQKHLIAYHTLPFAYEAFGGAASGTDYATYQLIIMSTLPTN